MEKAAGASRLPPLSHILDIPQQYCTILRSPFVEESEDEMWSFLLSDDAGPVMLVAIVFAGWSFISGLQHGRPTFGVGVVGLLLVFAIGMGYSNGTMSFKAFLIGSFTVAIGGSVAGFIGALISEIGAWLRRRKT